MRVTLAVKKNIVDEVSAVASKAVSAVVADYRGLTVNQMTDLRSKARQANVYLRVVRNTLSRRAFKDTDLECLNEKLVGPLFIALSLDAPGDAAKLLKEYTKSFEKLEVKALSVGGVLYDPQQLEAVASLPTKQEALSKLLFVMKAPVEKFVRTLAAPHTKLARTVAAIRDVKQSQ